VTGVVLRSFKALVNDRLAYTSLVLVLPGVTMRFIDTINDTPDESNLTEGKCPE
jgi:hypothetical protein